MFFFIRAYNAIDLGSNWDADGEGVGLWLILNKQASFHYSRAIFPWGPGRLKRARHSMVGFLSSFPDQTLIRNWQVHSSLTVVVSNFAGFIFNSCIHENFVFSKLKKLCWQVYMFLLFCFFYLPFVSFECIPVRAAVWTQRLLKPICCIMVALG